MNEKKLIRRAALIALFGNAFLAALKITCGSLAASGALVGDGIDSSADVLISIVTLVVVRMVSRPADAEHPWGHGRAETVATAVLACVLFFAGLQLIWTSLGNLRQTRELPGNIALIAVGVSIAGKIFLAWNQSSLGKRADSALIKANAKNMAADVLISLGVLVGLVVSHLTGSGIWDTVIAVLIGGWVIKTAVGIFRAAGGELMDGSVDAHVYQVVFDAAASVDGAEHPHRVRIRKIAGFLDIDMDIEVDPELTVLNAHRISEEVETAVKTRLPAVYDIMIHIEPRGCCNPEGFGWCKEDGQNQQGGALP